MTTSDSTPAAPVDFIRAAVAEDLRTGRYTHVQTRLPPEPNGYLHIGHAKAFGIDYFIARDFGGRCNLRFDDTNPVKEDTEYVDAIKEDIRWLGIDFGEQELYASDYFDKLYEWAIRLVKMGRAYVDDQSPEEVSRSRGTLTEPGQESPYRNRSVEENLDLLERMRKGEFPDGSRVLRAKIDMAAGNMNMRDPVMYRILHEPPHHRTGSKWCIYPMYDWAHGQNDSMEGVTHSFCDLGYEDHRPLYEWFLQTLGEYMPRQIEFARLKLTYTILSKRYLKRLVTEGLVRGWDDPRMPTLRGLRRRGCTSEALLDFISRVGIAKNDSTADLALLEACVREDLNKRCPRVMGVLHPLKVVIENYPEGQVEELEAVNNPEDPAAGTRRVPFSRVLCIEQDDFREVPPPKYYRLSPGREVRLRYAYYLKCESVVKNDQGEVVELRCTYDPATRGGEAADGRKVKATIHWVSAAHALPAEVRLYDRLFTKEDPNDFPVGQDFTVNLNPHSLEILPQVFVEPSLQNAAPGDKLQFERLGYFCVDPDSAVGQLVFNRTVTLKDEWAKIQQKARPA